MSWAVVVPTCRPEKFAEFTEAWTPLLKKHQAVLLVVQDSPEDFVTGGWLKYNHGNIPNWFPRGTDMLRSWGIYKAWQGGFTYTLSLDDDVVPEGDVFAAYQQVFESGAPLSSYLSVGSLTTSGLEMRGFPYADRKPAEVAVQYGGWHGVLDYDAATQLAAPHESESFSDVVMPVPRGVAVTGCAMNMAWRTKYAPAMWQLPLLDGRFNRYGDIWAGLFAKKTMDKLGRAVVVNGKASVRHDRASDPVTNLERETPGVRFNEVLWRHLHCQYGRHELLSAYRSVTDSAADFFASRDIDYARHFAVCRDRWLGLYAR